MSSAEKFEHSLKELFDLVKPLNGRARRNAIERIHQEIRAHKQPDSGVEVACVKCGVIYMPHKFTPRRLHFCSSECRKSILPIERMAAIGWDIGEKGCWIWRGPRLGGYAALWIGHKMYRGSHLAWSEENREHIPTGMVICHRCDNPPCVNPDHLFLGTTADNVADKVAKGRHYTPSKLTPDQVKEILKEKKRRGKPVILAKKYGVTKETIRLIQARKIWRHINI